MCGLLCIFHLPRTDNDATKIVYRPKFPGWAPHVFLMIQDDCPETAKKKKTHQQPRSSVRIGIRAADVKIRAYTIHIYGGLPRLAGIVRFLLTGRASEVGCCCCCNDIYLNKRSRAGESILFAAENVAVCLWLLFLPKCSHQRETCCRPESGLGFTYP